MRLSSTRPAADPFAGERDVVGPPCYHTSTSDTSTTKSIIDKKRSVASSRRDAEDSARRSATAELFNTHETREMFSLCRAASALAAQIMLHAQVVSHLRELSKLGPATSTFFRFLRKLFSAIER